MSAVRTIVVGLVLAGPAVAPAAQPPKREAAVAGEQAAADERFVPKTDAQWKKLLTPEQFVVTRKKGTERPFTGAYWNSKQAGTYTCVCCGAALFSSETKFDSGTGWPSYWQPVDPQRVRLLPDRSHGMERIEVVCRRCDAHLGHVFDDGPAPTGKRYCINSASLGFAEKKSPPGESPSPKRPTREGK